MMAIALASIFVYMVLAAQFESFIQPIVIMTVLPLSVPFALFTLWATGRPLSLWSALGVLLLLGIVKKNSILQVDYANVLRAQGKDVREAIVEASRTRLRPILMTTCAILAGLVPTAFGLGVGGQQRSAIAVTIIGGQSLCLFLTLLLVPVAYVKLDVLEQASTTRRIKAWIGHVDRVDGRTVAAGATRRMKSWLGRSSRASRNNDPRSRRSRPGSTHKSDYDPGDLFPTDRRWFDRVGIVCPRVTHRAKVYDGKGVLDGHSNDGVVEYRERRGRDALERLIVETPVVNCTHGQGTGRVQAGCDGHSVASLEI